MRPPRRALALALLARAGGHRLPEGPGARTRYQGNLFVGFSTLDTFNGPLFTFQVDDDELEFRDPRLRDKVADNLTFHEMT